jgi:conjugal transfer ATP-binding protein TraC
MLAKVKTALRGATSFEGAKNALRTRNKITINVNPESFDAVNPIHSIENDFIFSKDGMVYRGFKVAEPAYEKSDQSAFQKMAEALDMSYRDLPIGASVHRQIAFYNVYYNETSKDFELDYSKFFDYQKKVGMIESPILAHQSLIFIGLPANNDISTVKATPLNTIFASRGNKILSNPFKNVDYVIESIDDICTKFFSRLGVLDVRFKKMDTDELNSYVYKFLNLDYSKDGGIDLKNNYVSKFPYFMAGNKLVGVTSFAGELQEVLSSTKNEYGVESSFNYAMYYDLKFPHIVNQYVYVRDQAQVLAEVEETMNLMGQADSDKIIAAQMKNHINEVRSNNQKLLDIGTNIICWSSKEVELNHFLDSANNAIRAMGKCSAQVEVIEDVANIFWSSIPGSVHNNYRRFPYPSLYAGCCTTFPGQYYSAGNFIVRGREGKPIFIRIQPEDPKSSNNYIIVGPTGGGKSVFCNIKMAHYLEQGDEVLIVDKGASYKTLAQLFDLKYYDFTDLEKVDLNFFHSETDAFGKYILSQEKKTGIISVLRQLWRMDQKGMLSPTEMTCLETLIDMYYEASNKSGHSLIMDNLIRFLRDVKLSEVTDRLEVGSIDLAKYFDKDEFIMALSRYSSKASGYNGKIFNHEKSNYFAKGISSVYDIANIATEPELYTIFTISLSNVIVQGMYNRRHVRKHLAYDECSEALPGDQGKLLRMVFREVRKENGDVGIITQLITDITDNPNGKVILDNAINRYLLDHTMATGTLPTVQTALDLSPHKFDLLKSLNKIPNPNRREFFMQRLNTAGVYALELPESLRLGVSTSADDQKVLADLLKRIRDPRLALKTYVEELKHKAA